MLIALAIMLVVWLHPRTCSSWLAYTYLASAFIGLAITRWKHRGGRLPQVGEPTDKL